MIKGVNRQIIEVADTGSEYFERAMLFISPGFSETERHVLEREAKKMLRKMEGPSKMRMRRKYWYLVPRMAASAVVGAAVAVLAVFCI